MKEILYNLKEIRTITRILQVYHSDCKYFCDFMCGPFLGIVRRAVSGGNILKEELFTGFSEEDMKLIKYIIDNYRANPRRYVGSIQRHPQIDRVARFLYDIPLKRIPLEINHVSDPSKGEILKWRLKLGK